MLLVPLQHEASNFSSSSFEVIAIASSLGGIEALSKVLSALPADFPVPVLVVQHLQPTYKSQLVEIMQCRTALTVKWAEQGDYLCVGTIYIAPPDYHVIVTASGMITLSHSEKVQFTRPSANPLFESVAACYRERAIAVVLTGAGSDGANGVRAIKRNGGKVIVQNMATSQAFGMPGAALRTGCVDLTLSLRTISRALISLVMVKGAAQFFCVTPKTAMRGIAS